MTPTLTAEATGSPLRAFDLPQRPATRPAPERPSARPESGRPGPPRPDGAPQLVTDREFEALNLAADGLTAAQISERLGITRSPVVARLDRAGRHLGAVGDCTRAVAAAYRYGVFTPNPARAVPLPELSAGVWAVLPMLARYGTNKVIASRMRISQGAAGCRVRVLLSAFGAVNRVHLIRVAVDSGALTVPSLGLAPVAVAPGPVALDPVGVLTGRQAQALRLVASGLTDRQVGSALGVSESEAGRLMERAARRLGAVSRANAVHLAWSRGFLSASAGGVS